MANLRFSAKEATALLGPYAALAIVLLIRERGSLLPIARALKLGRNK